VVSFLICAALVLAAADDTAPKNDTAPKDNAAVKAELADQTAQLVRQLDAQQLAQRDEAEHKLMELGPDVLPLLPAIGERTSAEVALRITRVQQKLLRAQVLAAAEPSLVTLKGADLPLSEVFKDISKQTGNAINDHREAFGEQKDEVRVKVDFDKTPFWRAMDNVLDQAELTLYPFAGQHSAHVVSRPPGTAARSAGAVYAGLFRLEGVRFEAVRDLRNEQMESLKFFLEVTWEPRLQPFAIFQPLGQITVQGNTGEAIAVASSEAEPEVLVREGTSAAELEIPLVLPKRSTKKISVLKGKLLALVPGPFHDFRFSELPVAVKNVAPQRVEQRKASTTVTLDQVRKNNEAWEVSLRVKFDAPSTALESHRSWVLENEAFFEDAKGQRIEPGGIEQTLQSKDEMGINYFFDLKAGPEKLTFVYRTPITILEMPVTYEFRDLRLP
jgi:hypothetical protein